MGNDAFSISKLQVPTEKLVHI